MIGLAAAGRFLPSAIVACATTLFAVLISQTGWAKHPCCLRILTWGGEYAAIQSTTLWEPYKRESGTEVEPTAYKDLGGKSIQAAISETSWDIAEMSALSIDELCDAGLLEKIDWEMLGGKARFLPQAVRPCGVGSGAYSLAFAFNSEKATGKPASWSDFFDGSRFPGKRGMRPTPVGNLEIALMADGVPAQEVYRELQTESGVERAFAKLSAIKADIRWWNEPKEPVTLLTNSELAFSTVYSGEIASATAKDAPPLDIVQREQIVFMNYWAIPKNAKWREDAIDYLRLATRPDQQAVMARTAFIAPVVLDAFNLLEQDGLQYLPTNPANIESSLQFDDAFWQKNRDVLEKRFDAWRTS